MDGEPYKAEQPCWSVVHEPNMLLKTTLQLKVRTSGFKDLLASLEYT